MPGNSGKSGRRDEQPIDQIRPEHHRLRLIFEETQASLASGEGGAACAELREALEAHFGQEEALYFPTLWKLHPESEAKLRSLIVVHSDLLAHLELVVRQLEREEMDAAGETFDELRALFAAHEQAEEALLRSMG